MKSSRIHVLPPQIAERIAAGEVIERPASVIKELVENSIDAGATQIEVRLENGGRDLIEVTDDGHGMTAEELAISIQRHATSKIKALHDLDTLSSLGFRGEALPSIGAVSDVEILSRTEGDAHTHRLTIEDVRPSPVTRETHGHFLGSKHGTRFRSINLFARVPARLKFLKSQSAETSAVREILERLALTHPSVAFKLVADERTLLDLKPMAEPQRVAAVLAGEEGFKVLSDEVSRDGIRARVHWLKGASFPQTRKLAQVVNQRAIRDRLVQQAMLHAFKQHLLPGQFPAAAVYLELDPSLIDVNVHPTKSEVRFIDSRRVFHIIESAFSRLIQSHGAAPHLSVSPPANPGSFTGSFTGSVLAPAFANAFTQKPMDTLLAPTTQDRPNVQDRMTWSDAGRYMGQIFSTYLLFEKDGLLQVIDQHAAHERIRYEELRTLVFSSDRKPESQPLLIPETVHLESERWVEFQQRSEALEKIGFEFERFSETSVLFRSIPATWGLYNLKNRLKNLVEKLLDQEAEAQSNNLTFDERLFEALASEACHSSVRAGEVVEDLEARSLASRLLRCENPWNCPHGRPTVIEVPEIRFEEWFKRRV